MLDAPITLADLECEGGMTGRGREILEKYGVVVLKKVVDPAGELDPVLAEYDLRLDEE